MSSPIKVAVLGATGETGRSIVDGLLESPASFEVIALARPSSVAKPANAELKARGVKVIAVDLAGPEDSLVKVLSGVDTVICCVDPANFDTQYPLIDAAKAAGVKRFVPCNFGTIVPVGDILMLRDLKEKINNYVKKIYLPYTIIDVGWWYQLYIPAVPSGKADRAIGVGTNAVVDGGNVPNALIDRRDVGRYVARIIQDPRTLNRMVFAYGDVTTQMQSIRLMERLSGEKIKTSEISGSFIRSSIERMRPWTMMVELYSLQYMLTWGVRGDNTPEHADYFGYLNARELYPDITPISLETFYEQVLKGEIVKAYKDEPHKSTSTTKIATKMVSKTLTRWFTFSS